MGVRGRLHIFGVMVVLVLGLALVPTIAAAVVAPADVTVSGTVVSESTGVGVPFATIEVSQNGGPLVGVWTADWRGKFSFTVPPGTYEIYRTAPGWFGALGLFTIPASPSVTQNLTLSDRIEQPVYRFFNKKGGVHFYTATDAEFINTYQNLGDTFTYDGIAYFVSVGPLKGQVPLYRFFNKKTGVHFFTASEAEKNNVIATLSDLFVYEGVAYNVRIDGLGIPVHRYYVPSRNTHFYTADTSEITLRSGLSSSYHYEGIAFYVGQPAPD